MTERYLFPDAEMKSLRLVFLTILVSGVLSEHRVSFTQDYNSQLLPPTQVKKISKSSMTLKKLKKEYENPISFEMPFEVAKNSAREKEPQNTSRDSQFWQEFQMSKTSEESLELLKI